jgi:S1-C subfamily serine protease
MVAGLTVSLLTRNQEILDRDDVETVISEVLDDQPRPDADTALAYRAVAGSVVRVEQGGADQSVDIQRGVGSGVVIDATGTVLTNLHVVEGAETITIVFTDGFETEAQVTSAQPENDLAVLEPEVIPEGLPSAILGSSASLSPGDTVIAVGHPFGIGPSISGGVVSGLGRRYFSIQGGTILDNLIQFDAAANPGNSGGPLVNRDGEVVGIVTSILNPTEGAFFVGIGFAVPIETAAAAAGPSPF